MYGTAWPHMIDPRDKLYISNFELLFYSYGS